MAYSFRGVFIERPALSERELEELFGGYARSIEAPFVGVVLSFRDDLDEDDDRATVVEKSRSIPDSRVAFIKYTCWGGALDYVGGFGCRNGELVESSERGSESESCANLKELEKVGNRIFVSLLEFVGAKSPSLNFPPFERGYFPNT